MTTIRSFIWKQGHQADEPMHAAVSSAVEACRAGVVVEGFNDIQNFTIEVQASQDHINAGEYLVIIRGEKIKHDLS